MDIRVPPPKPPRNPAAAAAAAAAERRAAGTGAGTVNPPPGPPAQPRDHQPTSAAARPPPGPSAPPRDRQPTQGQPEASRKEGAETKERRKESRAEAAAVISSLYGIAPGQPNPDHASPAFREALTITGHLPTVDLLVLGRTLMNPDNGFRRFWDQFREMEFGPGERGRRAREEAKDELRKLASRWLMTAAEKKRRRLTGPNGDRNARGRHFFHHLRMGVILSDAELDSILAQSHKDSAKGIRSTPSTLTNRQPPAALVAPSPRRPAQGGAQGGTGETPTPTTGPSSSRNPAGADATPNPPRQELRARLDARTAPLIPPQPRDGRLDARTAPLIPPQSGGSRASSRGRGTSGPTDRRSRGPSPTPARPGPAPVPASGNPLTYPNNIEQNIRQNNRQNSNNRQNNINQTTQVQNRGGPERVAGTDPNSSGSGRVEASSESRTSGTERERGGSNGNERGTRVEELEEGEIADDPPPNPPLNQDPNQNSNSNLNSTKNRNKNSIKELQTNLFIY